jgi:putative lipoic acid-binding regulatory protein
MSDNSEQKGFEFPGLFEVKVFGPNTDAFEQEILALLTAHQTIATSLIGRMISSAGTYRSLTIPMRAETREELERFYASARSHPDTKWTL